MSGGPALMKRSLPAASITASSGFSRCPLCASLQPVLFQPPHDPDAPALFQVLPAHLGQAPPGGHVEVGDLLEETIADDSKLRNRVTFTVCDSSASFTRLPSIRVAFI
jgi:hypothetical protein